MRMWKEGGGLRVPTTNPTIFEDQYKGQRSISNLILQCHNSSPPHNLTISKEESRRKRQEEARGCMGNYEEVLEEGRGPRVPRSKGYMVQWSSGCGSRKGNVTCPQGWGGSDEGKWSFCNK